MRRVLALLALVLLLWPAHPVAANVFAGDPTDPVTGLPYPMLPGAPLVLPGEDMRWNTGDETIDTTKTGDVDLVVRVGDITANAVPPPAGASGGPALMTITAGGGATGTGNAAAVTLLVSDGSGNPPYGNVLTSSALDGRPAVIYAWADLDGDGVVGPTNSDGAADNTIERQEAWAYAGRQIGMLSAGRMRTTLGLRRAAPASIGGLAVTLSGGAYTGDDAEELYTDGTPIFTLWPAYPPFDPERVIKGNTPPPSAGLPTEIEFEPTELFVPDPGDPVLGDLLAVPVDGSEPTTDQLIVVSGPAVAAATFLDVDPASYRPRGLLDLRPAPPATGGGRVLVLAADRVAIAVDGAATTRDVRLLAVDVLGNVADPPPGGTGVTLRAEGAVRIVAPDTDADPSREQILLTDATGAVITLDDVGTVGLGLIDIETNGRLTGQTVVVAAAPADEDGDGVLDDGDASGMPGDHPCDPATVAGGSCDDNCPNVINPMQTDDDVDGLGDCCDGTCSADPAEPGCGECQLALGTFSGSPNVVAALRTIVRTRTTSGTNGKDVIRIKATFFAGSAIAFSPPSETVSVVLDDGNGTIYQGALASAFDDKSGPRQRYIYRDPTGAVAGIRKAVLRERHAIGQWTLVWKARGAGILANPSPASVALEVALGDDRITDTAVCTIANPAKANCR